MIAGWIETCRSVVSPWECDITEHFTIAYYFDRLADASSALAETLGWGDHPSSAGRRFDLRFVRELRAGASFHILSGPIGIEDGTVRLGHQLIDSGDGVVSAWVEETLEDRAAGLLPEIREEIRGGLLPWEGPAIERRPEPTTLEGFIPTARDRVRPTDLDASGDFTLAAFVHRFTAGCIQALAAIGATSSYMQAERRGYSTFELSLTIKAAPRLGGTVVVETAIAHLGASSIRLVHRMFDPNTGREFARLGQFGVQLDLDARRPTALPDPIRSAATRLLVPVA